MTHSDASGTAFAEGESEGGLLIAPSHWFTRYVMPGLVFESVVIGGGYATGRELVEFFLRASPLSGLLAMGVTLCVWSMVLAATFEFARTARSFDYHSFFRELLGAGAPAFEIAYALLLILVLSVLGAAAGSIIHERFDVPTWIGAVILMALISFVLYFGSVAVERVLSVWAMVLYGVFSALVAFCFFKHGATIEANLQSGVPVVNWMSAGIIYAGYNLASAPSVIFCCRHMTARREAIIAGLLGGVLAIVPGILLLLALLAYYPEILHQPVPTAFVMSRVSSPVFRVAFAFALFGTLVKTGVGLLHALNERIAVAMTQAGKSMPAHYRVAVPTVVMGLALFAAERFGIIGLIAKGYGSLTYAFIVIYVLPILTIGVWRIIQSPR